MATRPSALGHCHNLVHVIQRAFQARLFLATRTRSFGVTQTTQWSESEPLPSLHNSLLSRGKSSKLYCHFEWMGFRTCGSTLSSVGSFYVLLSKICRLAATIYHWVRAAVWSKLFELVGTAAAAAVAAWSSFDFFLLLSFRFPDSKSTRGKIFVCTSVATAYFNSQTN